MVADGMVLCCVVLFCAVLCGAVCCCVCLCVWYVVCARVYEWWCVEDEVAQRKKEGSLFITLGLLLVIWQNLEGADAKFPKCGEVSLGRIRGGNTLPYSRKLPRQASGRVVATASRSSSSSSSSSTSSSSSPAVAVAVCKCVQVRYGAVRTVRYAVRHSTVRPSTVQ